MNYLWFQLNVFVKWYIAILRIPRNPKSTNKELFWFRMLWDNTLLLLVVSTRLTFSALISFLRFVYTYRIQWQRLRLPTSSISGLFHIWRNIVSIVNKLLIMNIWMFFISSLLLCKSLVPDFVRIPDRSAMVNRKREDIWYRTFNTAAGTAEPQWTKSIVY